jgi:hypothetical protein
MLPPVLPLAAPPACVSVVVDYGTLAGAPAGPNTHCTGAASGDTAAAVLARRSTELGSAPPRYRGNFLCAIDGYPKPDSCGDHGNEPYWSFWIWAGGKWSYSQLGVDSYTTGDSDHDGCQDPLGFRYTEFRTTHAPRATPPRCATPTQPPGNPKSPPARRPPVGGPPAGPPTAGSGNGTGTGSGSGSGTGNGASGAPPTSAPPAAGSGGPSGSPTAAAPDGTSPAPAPATTTPPGLAAPRRSTSPVGVVVTGLVAAALIVAAAVRMRRTP